MHHLVGQALARAAAPGDADGRAAGHPDIVMPRRGADQHGAVRRVGDGAAHDALDAELG